jgi:hypothetical protein
MNGLVSEVQSIPLAVDLDVEGAGLLTVEWL